MAKGYLVFIGGGKDSSFINSKIFELAGGKDNVKLAIIPSASSHIRQTMDDYKEYFHKELGLKEENVWTVPLASEDGEGSLSPQERLWVDNAYNEQIVERLKTFNVIFLVGGDQRKYIQTLKKNGQITPVLQAINYVYDNGGIIAGTSAGSNVMSKKSIGGGRSEEALTKKIALNPEDDDGEKLFIFNGLNLIEDVIVDTHFSKRGRFGRLIQSAVLTKSRFGLGISERTGLIFHPDSTIEVIGYGTATMIDLEKAVQVSKDDEFLHLQGIKIHLFSLGDTFNILTGKLNPEKDKRNIKYTPFNGVRDYNISLNAFGEFEVATILTKYILDNEAKEAIAIMDFEKIYIDGDKSTFIRFIESDDTEAYYCKKALGNRSEEVECYCGKNIYTDIVPLHNFNTQGWSKRLNAVIFGIKNDCHIIVFDNDRTNPISDAKIEIYETSNKELIYRTGTSKFGKATIQNFLKPTHQYSIVIEYDRDSILTDFTFDYNMQGFYINN